MTRCGWRRSSCARDRRWRSTSCAPPKGFVGELLRAVAEARHDPALAAELRAQLQPLVDKLGDELPGDVDVAALLDEVEAHLVSALVAP